MVGEETSDKERAELRETLGLMDPIHIQFSRFVVNASKGEFGISYQLRRPVSELISERLPATIELVLISALIALVSGTLLGVYTGINRKGFLSDIILAISLLGVSLPTFAACANKTTPEYPVDAVYIPTGLVGATCVIVLNTLSASAILLISS